MQLRIQLDSDQKGNLATVIIESAWVSLAGALIAALLDAWVVIVQRRLLAGCENDAPMPGLRLILQAQ